MKHILSRALIGYTGLSILQTLAVASDMTPKINETEKPSCKILMLNINNMDEDRRVAGALGNQKPLYTLEEAASKVEKIFRTMQSREKDFQAVFQHMLGILGDESIPMGQRIDAIDPWWGKNINRDKNYLNNSIPKEVKLKSSTGDEGMNRLKVLGSHKKAVIHGSSLEFKDHIERSQRAVLGFSRLIEFCEEYKKFNDIDDMYGLLDCLVSSFYLNIIPTIDDFILKNDCITSQLSLEREKIDQYYTQDSRLTALSQIYYIVDFVEPIRILINAGLNPLKKYWDLSDHLKKYVKGEITLDSPHVFLMDGFVYKKIFEKDPANNLLTLKNTNKSLPRNGVVEGGIKLKYNEIEKNIIKKEFKKYYDIYLDRVNFYINNLSHKDKENIEKSREMLNGLLLKESGFVINADKRQDSTTLSQVSESGVRKNKKKHTVPARISGVASGNDLALIKELEKNGISPEFLGELLNGGDTKKSKHGKNVESRNAKKAKNTKGYLTSVKPVNTPVNADNNQGLSDKTRTSENFNTNTKDVINPLHSEPVLNVQKDEGNVNAFSLQQSEKTPEISAELKIRLPQRQSGSSSSIIQMKKSDKKIATATEIKPYLKDRIINVLKAIMDKQTKPFTIDYTEALNAMGRIGISEYPPRGGGDFRKLKAQGPEGNVLFREASYRPATSMLGRELMGIFRSVIERQLEQRTDIKLDELA